MNINATKKLDLASSIGEGRHPMPAAQKAAAKPRMNVAYPNMWRRAKSMPCINQTDASCATYGEVTGYVRRP
jgi:hypothetical protein